MNVQYAYVRVINSAENVQGYVFVFVCLFVCLSVCKWD